MSRITRWWARRSGPERFDLYTRATVYVISGLAPLVALAVVAGADTGATGGAGAFVALSVAHTAACVHLLHAGFGHSLRRRPYPVRGLVAVLVLAAAQVATAASAFGASLFAPDGSSALFDVLHLVGIATLAATAPLLRARRVAVLGAAWAVAIALAAVREGLPWDAAALLAAAVAAGTLWFALSYRSSLWAVGVLWEMDRTRGVQARLAVAEERLRFSRDLHDVLGRNLSVVAVRSELAAELARRGRPEAVAEMLGVRQLAQDSLRDLREVVRGYRGADLRAELDGARSVLRAAGIGTAVHLAADPLPGPVQEALGWAAREATTNVLRHSSATRCRIDVAVDAGSAVLTVDNDGVRRTRPGSAGDSPLTPREADVLELVADGAAVDEVAARAGLSPGTVRNYLSSAVAKLGAADRHGAVRAARRHGWI